MTIKINTLTTNKTNYLYWFNPKDYTYYFAEQGKKWTYRTCRVEDLKHFIHNTIRLDSFTSGQVV